MNKKEQPNILKNKKKCCGCTACYAICPKHAIAMVEDEKGFKYPHISEKECICCYRCIRVCPIRTVK